MLFIAKYWRVIGIAALVAIAIGAGIYIRCVFAERDRLLQDKATLNQEKALLTEQLKGAAAIQQLTNTIIEELGNIEERSQANVSHIEKAPKPVFVAARPLPFIPGGVLQAVYSSAAPPGTAPAAAPGQPLPAGQPAGRVLSR